MEITLDVGDMLAGLTALIAIIIAVATLIYHFGITKGKLNELVTDLKEIRINQDRTDLHILDVISRVSTLEGAASIHHDKPI